MGYANFSLVEGAIADVIVIRRGTLGAPLWSGPRCDDCAIF